MNRRGASLMVVLVGLLVLSGATGLLFSLAQGRLLAGRASLDATRVRLAAEGASEWTLVHWPLPPDSLAVGSAVALPTAVIPGSGLALNDSLIRLGDVLYLLRTVASRYGPGAKLRARDGVGRLVQWIGPEFPDGQALAAVGATNLEGASRIDGADHVPVTWGGVCPVPGAVAAGLRTPDASIVGPCAGAGCLSGSPPVAADSTLVPDFLEHLTPVTVTGLIGSAGIAVSGEFPGVGPPPLGSGCDRSIRTNWGDPSSVEAECGGYFPIVVAGDGSRLTGTAGQGILIGLGRLELAGELTFHGVVLALGSLELRDRAHVVGTVLAAGAVHLADESSLVRSTCAVRRASRGVPRQIGPVERGWIRWP